MEEEIGTPKMNAEEEERIEIGVDLDLDLVVAIEQGGRHGNSESSPRVIPYSKTPFEVDPDQEKN